MNNFKWKSQQLLGFPVSFGVFCLRESESAEVCLAPSHSWGGYAAGHPSLGQLPHGLQALLEDGKCGKAGHAQNQVWFWFKRATYNQWPLTSWPIRKFFANGDDFILLPTSTKGILTVYVYIYYYKCILIIYIHVGNMFKCGQPNVINNRQVIPIWMGF